MKQLWTENPGEMMIFEPGSIEGSKQLNVMSIPLLIITEYFVSVREL